MNTKKFVISAIAILLGLILIFVFVWFARQQQNEAQLQEAGIVTPGDELPAIEVFAISAQVREVRENSLLVDVLDNNLTNQALSAREVLITNDTVIRRRALKDSQVYERELTAYRNLIANLKAQAEATGIQPEEWPPVPTNFTETAITFNQIAVGNRVWITTNEDTRTAERFTATSIKIEI